MKLQITSALAILILATGSSYAGSFATQSVQQHTIAKTHALSLTTGGGMKDTCTTSQEGCDIDGLVARCDAAGGGMVTLPGGGVECNTDQW